MPARTDGGQRRPVMARPRDASPDLVRGPDLAVAQPMTPEPEPLTPPPRQCNAAGEPRQVGLEFEFAGVGLLNLFCPK